MRPRLLPCVTSTSGRPVHGSHQEARRQADDAVGSEPNPGNVRRKTETEPSRTCRAPRPTEVWSGLEPEFVRGVAADRLKALGHPDRLRIVEALTRTPMNVSELAHVVGMRNQATSRHLRLLADADVVRCSRRGNHVLYALADRDVARLIAVAYRGASAQAQRRLSITRPS